MIVKISACLLLCSLCFPIVVNADVYYQKREEGWFWGKEGKIKEKKEPEKKNIPEKVKLTPGELSIQRVDKIKQKTKELKSLAVTVPTNENLVNYMTHQKEIFDMAQKFTGVWKMALLTNPELDYTADHPISAIGLQASEKQKYFENARKVSAVGEEAGIYFIFSSECPYCVEQSRILKRFEEKYDFTITPITINGQGLPEYPDPLIDTWVMDRMDVKKTPTLFLAYPRENKILPLASGLVTENDLIKRVLMLDETGEKNEN